MSQIVILGVFVADTTYRAERQPHMGETILGTGFSLGPGGKGSNQAVAAGRLGGDVSIISKIGQDAFGEMAKATWKDAGVKPAVKQVADNSTGAAFIFIENGTGDNAIIISPGAAGTLSPADIDEHADLIRNARVFITQLEQPIPAAKHALSIARSAGVITILNPAPAAPLDDEILTLCDYITPNETEATALTTIQVASADQARMAADALIGRGVGSVIVTLGEHGALIHGNGISAHVGAFNAGPVVETTGAGDAFNAAFAVGLAEGMTPQNAVRFGCATAAISVTRAGAAASMPLRAEVDALLHR